MRVFALSFNGWDMRVHWSFVGFLLAGHMIAQQPIQLEDIWVRGSFASKGVPGFTFQKDGVHFTRSNGGVIAQFDLRSGKNTGEVFNIKTVRSVGADWPGVFSEYVFSPDEKHLLLSTQEERLYRHSRKADYYVYDSGDNSIRRLHTGKDKQRYPTFSPQSDKVAYECLNNLYVRDLKSGAVVQVTNDGAPNAVINGASDWVYEEEFVLVSAFDWSPDGQKLAFLRFDESDVPEFAMETYHPDAMYPSSVVFKYPKVGEKNAVVTAWIFDLATGKTIKVNTMAGEADYFPRMRWAPNGALCLTWLNRHQNHLKLLLADPHTGACRVLLEERNPFYFDETYEPFFLDDGSGFIWQSERDGYRHLYRYDMEGKVVGQLTTGDWEVTAFYGVDQKNKKVYYQSATLSGKPSALHREVREVTLDGKIVRLMQGNGGFHSAEFSSTFDYYIHRQSNANTPARYVVRDRKGKELRVLEDNEALKEKMKAYGVLPVQFFQFETEEGTVLNGWWIQPTMGANTEPLPLLMFVYGGPGSQQVTDDWMGANYWWFQMLASQGYAIACVDNRGTGGRGEAFKKVTYMRLGHLETQDQIAAARWLGAKPFIDPNRIGIFGWSYGGYMSSLCLLKGADVFKAAIAVAPVTNWKWYDTIYTERFMRTHAENTEGYEMNSPVNFASNLKGAYLIVHGQADDNVHFQHTVEMVSQLIAQDKDFEVVFYPNRNHGIYGGNTRLHLYRKMTQFLDTKLKG